MKALCRLLFWGVIFCTTSTVYAVNATNFITNKKEYGHWKVLEFTKGNNILYRLASVSTNDPSMSIVFNLEPDDRCIPTPAVMVLSANEYVKNFDDGMVILSYKLSGHQKNTELVKTVMSKANDFAFFVFERLKVQWLLPSGGIGKLTVWVPPSGDGAVKRGANIYFSLSGILQAYRAVKRLCTLASASK